MSARRAISIGWSSVPTLTSLTSSIPAPSPRGLYAEAHTTRSHNAAATFTKAH